MAVLRWLSDQSSCRRESQPLGVWPRAEPAGRGIRTTHRTFMHGDWGGCFLSGCCCGAEWCGESPVGLRRTGRADRRAASLLLAWSPGLRGPGTRRGARLRLVASSALSVLGDRPARCWLGKAEGVQTGTDLRGEGFGMREGRMSVAVSRAPGTGAGRCDGGCQPACSVCRLALGRRSAKVLSDDREWVLASSLKRTNKRAIMGFRAPRYLPQLLLGLKRGFHHTACGWKTDFQLIRNALLSCWK